MKTIIIANDFSAAALNAAEYAADMAAAINAGLLLFHVIPTAVTYTEIPVIINEDEMLRNKENKMNELKVQLLARVKSKIDINTEVRMGIFFHELKTVCENIKPYAVVMGSQGTTAAERFLFGSHTVHAMNELMWPLITVPPGLKFSAIKKVGLACDFNNVVKQTPIDEIKMLVKDFTAELHVLNTGKEKVFNPDIVFQSGLLQEMLKGLKPFYHFISGENADEGIMDFAEKNNIDLLIVLPRRHSLLNKLIRKSHSKQFVLHSHVPVMVLH
jgi:nucleotide-binding universal stress UspA family protein